MSDERKNNLTEIKAMSLVSGVDNLQRVDTENISDEKREFLEQQMRELAVETDELIAETKPSRS